MSCYMNQVIQSYHNLIINGSSGMYLPKTLLFMSRILELFDFICNTLTIKPMYGCGAQRLHNRVKVVMLCRLFLTQHF